MKSILAVQDHWKNIRHQPGVHPHEKIFINDLVAYCKKSRKILEVGVGDGRMQRVLINNGIPTSSLYGVDLTDNMELSPGKKYIVRPLHNLRHFRRDNRIGKLIAALLLGIILGIFNNLICNNEP